MPTHEERRAQNAEARKLLLWYVLPLFDDRGRRRSKEELHTQGWRVGHVHIEAADPLMDDARPNARASFVLAHPAHAKPYFGALYDPAIVSMDSHRMVMRGYQMRDIGYGVEHTVQVWLLKKAEA